MKMSNRLNFHTIRYRNFMGVGNQWVEVQLDAAPKTIVYGKNGAGKSTLYEALFFCLFNKAFRKGVNKPDLVNNINNKGLEVEITLTSSGIPYKICRGVKPAKFEIYKDGVLEDQTSATTDYQAILENNILKMGPKNSGQTMILGSKMYTPFMKLTPPDRRNLVEEVLDIQIFSHMNSVTKAKRKILVLEMDKAESALALKQNSIDHTKTLIQSLAGRNKETQQRLVGEIDLYQKQIPDIQYSIDKEIAAGEKLQIELDEIIENGKALGKELEAIPEPDTSGRVKLQEKLDYINENQRKFQAEIVKAQSEIDNEQRNLSRNELRINKDIKFYAENPVCPTCKQDITEEHRGNHDAKYASELADCRAEFAKIKEANEKTIRDYQAGVDVAVDERTKVQEEMVAFDRAITAKRDERAAITQKMAVLRSDAMGKQNQIKTSAATVTRYEGDLAKTEQAIADSNSRIASLDDDVDVSDKKAELKKMESELADQNAKYDKDKVDLAEYDVILSLLKDDGIKKAIIKTYIPVINKLIRKYLDILGFNVGFILDEQFKETISVVGRRDLSYGSFSAGEQMRIDLALLFAFREIPIIKGGNTTNLMIFDEVADSALDVDGWDAFFTIIESITDVSNVFVISPKGDELTGRFNNAIKFKKSGSFTKMDDTT
jgi:DNA repair exonuclease SbcCD ATPase subunit